MWPLSRSQSTPILHCLPTSVRDPFGRPILVIEVIPASKTLDTFKPLIIQAFERLRILLEGLNNDEDPRSRPTVLQYMVLLDLKEFSFKDFVSMASAWFETVPDYSKRILNLSHGLSVKSFLAIPECWREVSDLRVSRNSPHVDRPS
jgi:hypothetical protein